MPSLPTTKLATIATIVLAVIEVVTIAVTGLCWLVIPAGIAPTYIAVGAGGIVQGNLSGIVPLIGGGLLVFLGLAWYRLLIEILLSQSFLASRIGTGPS